jgi:hypothetical protein
MYLGGLAQLGEHLLCKQGVVGSIPSTSTTYFEEENKPESRMRMQEAHEKFRFGFFKTIGCFVL